MSNTVGRTEKARDGIGRDASSFDIFCSAEDLHVVGEDGDERGPRVPHWPLVHEHLGAELFAVAPARDVLAVSPPENVNELQEIIARVWPDGDHLLTREVYLRAEGSWKLHLAS